MNYSETIEADSDLIIDYNDQDVKRILKPFADGLRPVPLLSVSDWANTYRFLTSKSSAEPGRYRVSRMPYNRKIMDCLGKTSDTQEVVYVKASQVGGTELGNCWIGYTIHLDPGPFMLVMPTDDAIKKNSRTRIMPMIESSPALKDKIKAVGSKDAENTINNKSFPGGALMMVGANSPTPLSSTPIAKLMLDEVDRYPLSAGDEGSPVELARARTRTFSNRKIFLVSTPTNEGVSVIWDEFLTTDQQYYHVPCLHCNELFVLKFEQLTWDEGKPETVRLACPHCGGLHAERDKTRMFEEKGYSENGRAEWISTAVSENPRKEGFHVSALYSPAGMYSWEELIRDFLKIKGDENKQQTFVNTILGETYKISGEVPDSENLYNRRENYEIGVVPSKVAFLTIGADVQPNRIEAEVVGWCRERESYSIGYYVFLGDTSKPEVWQQLRDLIHNQFTCEDGSSMGVKLACVDSGYNTKTVYDFCSSMGHDRVVPIKGMPRQDVMVNFPKILNVTKTGKKIGSSKVWGVGVSIIKSEVYGFLKLRASEVEGVEIYPPGYCHFPQYNREYFDMLTAEQLQMRKDKRTGKVSYEWVKKRDRNEALDCRVYARAASYIVGIDRWKESTWEKISRESRVFKRDELKSEAAVKPKKKSGYWDRR